MQIRQIVILLISLAKLFDINAFGQTDEIKIYIKPLFEFGGAGTDTGQFFQPLGISTDPAGNIYIADTGNNRIQVFTATGQFLKAMGGFGWDKEQFNRPVDVCATNGLDVFIADYANHRIERYDRYLNWLSSYYSENTRDKKLQFGYPVGVSMSKHGELFVVDGENFRILKINSFGEPEFSFGDFDWGDAQLQRPYRLDINTKDVIGVSDLAANRVVLLDYYGNLLSELTGTTLNEPKGICWFNQDFLCVIDSGHHRVLVVNLNGQVLLEFGSQGKGIGAFQNPSGIACFNSYIYVLDTGNNRVQAFTIKFVTAE